jgi:hypothetical protein
MNPNLTFGPRSLCRARAGAVCTAPCQGTGCREEGFGVSPCKGPTALGAKLKIQNNLPPGSGPESTRNLRFLQEMAVRTLPRVDPRGRRNQGQKSKPSTGYMKAVSPDFVACISEVWPAPGARKGHRKCGGLRPPPSRAFTGPRGRPDLENAPPKIRPDCLQVPRFLLWP